jgi:predicted DNA-binding protein with PD1-like motif
MNVYRGATAVEVIAIRLDRGDDLADSLARAARDLQLAAGAVISGAGSLTRFALETIATETYPPAVNVVEKQGPGQIIAAQGIIASESLSVTLTVARRTEIFCGQALPGTLVLHSAEFVVLRAGGTRWAYPPQAETGAPMLEAVAPPSAHAAAPLTLLGRPVDVTAVALVPPGLIRRHHALPVARTSDTLVVAMADPNNPFAIDDFRAATGLRVQAVAVPPQELLRAIEMALTGRA